MPQFERGLLWFRRDLRIDDQTALARALASCRQVFGIFVFDTEILDPLLAKGLQRDRRVEFIHDSIVELSDAIRAASPGRDAGLIVRHGVSRDIVPAIAAALSADAVFVNRDYEPAAIERDRDIAERLGRDGRALVATKDQAIFERDEIVTKAGGAFTVFTPYKRAWLKALTSADVEPRTGAEGVFGPVPAALDEPVPTLEAMGFAKTNLDTTGIPTGMSGAHELVDAFRERIAAYADARDAPAVRGTSYLSVHLRFGTVSIRALARAALDRVHGEATDARGAETWLGELIWRDFYFQILAHRPDVASGASFKPRFERIAWVDGAAADERFAAWCEARTGYPLVDAAMTQLNTTGFMHNRLRMVTASFLSKDLGIDWRRGEAYFADHLNDFELSSNNGGWQWASSSGCDAQPWFRIFNPVTQSERFDADGAFIRRYLPRLAALPAAAIHAPWRARADLLAAAGITLGRDYAFPIVDHETARAETLARYAVVRSSGDAAEDAVAADEASATAASR